MMPSINEYGSMECVCDRGDAAGSLGVVIEGALAVSDGSGGYYRPYIEENGLICEFEVFSSSCTVSYRVVANTNAKVIFLSKDFFLRMCSNPCESKNIHGEIVKNMFRLLSDSVVTLNKKIEYLSAPDIKTKIAKYLCELHEASDLAIITMPLNRDKLAAFFSVARPSLSRELVGLRNEGIIKFNRSSVEILDLKRLCGIAGV